MVFWGENLDLSDGYKELNVFLIAYGSHFPNQKKGRKEKRKGHTRKMKEEKEDRTKERKVGRKDR